MVVGATGELLGSRRQELVTPLDVLPTLAEWFGHADLVRAFSDDEACSLGPLLRSEDVNWRAEVVLQDDEGNAALRTDEFLFVVNVAEPLATANPVDLSAQEDSLFLKPEDVWEVNDVAEQHPDHVVALRTTLTDRLRSRCSRPPHAG